MDGVLADFERAVLDAFQQRYPGMLFIPLEQRTKFYIHEDYPPEAREFLEHIYHAEQFYAELAPIPGAIEGFNDLSQKHDVYICTSPLLQNPFCILEKFEWVREHLGEKWTERTLVVKDKTLIRADYLIDDKPEVRGADEPSWQHVLFDQPYNRRCTKRPRMNWQNWRDVF